MIAKNHCCATVAPGASEVIPAVTSVPCPSTGPLAFGWSALKPIPSSSWSAFKDSLVTSIKENQKIQITGLFRKGETNTSGLKDLGMARATEVSKLLGLEEDKIQLVSKEVPMGKYSKDCKVNGVSIRNVIVTDKIKEIEDKTLIYFPFNSTNKLDDREVEAYLRDVADRVKRTGERIRLTGHTDDIGDLEPNMALGQRRADIIKSFLTSSGVSASKIIARSSGETKPVATNDTDQGRQKNRRTELQIIK